MTKRITALVLAALVAGTSAAAAQSRPDVRLVLQVTVDGLRADRLSRYGDRFGEGGFRHLLVKGAVYSNAHYQHANTETIVGHTILATGAFPSENGMVGKAFWYSTDTGDFVTSAYYYDAYPEWAREWNAGREAGEHAGTSWTLLNDPSTYVYADQDDRPYEVDLKGYSRVFPHPFGEGSDKLFPTKLLVSPVGDRLLLDFAKALLEGEGLGADGITDYLSISFSAVVAVNHFFGPSSLENEDVVLQLDRSLADLFTFIDGKVGLEHTLIVFSADHDMAEMPEYMTELGHEAGRISPDDIVEAANEAGKKVFGVDGIAKFFSAPTSTSTTKSSPRRRSTGQRRKGQSPPQSSASTGSPTRCRAGDSRRWNIHRCWSRSAATPTSPAPATSTSPRNPTGSSSTRALQL